MLESILEQLLGKPGRCDNVGEFVSTIRQELEPNQVIYFHVLDHGSEFEGW